MNRLGLIAALVAAAPGATGAGAPLPASLCVTNASAQRYHFTVRTIDAAARVGRDLAPGQTLCLDHGGRGVVAAFETAASLEGCSRLVPAGGSETLILFGRFDRCAWGGADD
ncbi:MAG TPA: hypothetical protein DIU07_13265 [Rhodobacteraceae bacterium]|nr:hypothetical protein [Paracoccaceae bacterium]